MKAIDTIGRFDMLRSGDAVVVGVSGGADSMALLHMLCSLREPLDLKVYAAHINHGLRGAESLRDEDFVRKSCEEWHVELFVLKADVALEAANAGESLEEAGRRVRYAFFKKTANTLSAKIATAHTLSDSIETMLLNLTRGTGLKGLCGIPPIREKIIRPLIETTRREVEEYCEKNAIIYMNDSTNFSRDYTRNRIRLDVVPVLYEINPAFDRAALRAMRSLAEDEALLSSLSNAQLSKARTDEREYDAQALRGCPPELMRRVLAKAAFLSTGKTQEAQSIEKLHELLHQKNGGVSIKGGYSAHIKGGKLVFHTKSDKTRGGFCVPFGPGAYDFGGLCLKISLITINEFKILKNINKSYFKYAIDCDKIKGITVIRSKRPGEGFTPAGRGVRKSFKKLFNEAGVPVEDRGSVPVIADEEGIAWVYGFGADERCKVIDETQRVFLIKTTEMGG